MNRTIRITKPHRDELLFCFHSAIIDVSFYTLRLPLITDGNPKHFESVHSLRITSAVGTESLFNEVKSIQISMSITMLISCSPVLVSEASAKRSLLARAEYIQRD